MSGYNAFAIGIDLGTSFSRVGVFRHGAVEIIANDQGSSFVPSFVAFTDTATLIGDAAMLQVASNTNNTVFDVKRLIGRTFHDKTVQADMKHWPFKVIGERNKPKVSVMIKGQEKRFNPEEISAMQLRKMKETAETYLGQKVTDAVITVPTYFNDSQRQATKDAGKIAGLNVLRIINEPTAAALAYGLNKKLQGERKVLIFDLGGGTLDVSILAINEDCVFEVKATAGDTHLGGEDFDARLVERFAAQFKLKHGKDLHSSAKSLCRLRIACERAKRNLSRNSVSILKVNELFEGIDFQSKITRALFESICIDLFGSTIDSIETALADAKLDRSDINDVVLVGGSTRIVKIQTMLKDFFRGKDLCMSIDPEEAVVYGAAIQAANLSGDTSINIRDVLLLEVTPFSLGIERSDGVMERVIDRNTVIPCRTSQLVTTSKDNQSAIELNVYEGEQYMTKYNNLLGVFNLANIPLAPRGVPEIEVFFDIDSNGILQISADTSCSRTSKIIYINNDNGRLSREEVERMADEAKELEAVNQAITDQTDSQNFQQSYANSILQSSISAPSEQLSQEEKEKITKIYTDTFQWLNTHATAEKSDIDEKLRAIEKKLAHLMSK